MFKSDHHPDSEITGKDLLGISILSIVEALQIFILLSWAFNFLPVDNSLRPLLLPEEMEYLQPERDAFLFRIFVAVTIVFQMAGMCLLPAKLKSKDFAEQLWRFMASEIVVLAVLLFSLGKILLYGKHHLFAILMFTAVGLASANKIFWWRGREFRKRIFDGIMKMSAAPAAVRSVDILFPVVIGLSIFIPDLKGAIARIYVNDRFYHFDSFIAGPGWAHLKGLALQTDIFSQYGVGMPVWISSATQMFWGKYSYENILLTFMLMAIVYFILVYVFLRQWLGNPVIAVVGVLWALKLQMFLSDPFEFFAWKHPSGTVVRYFFDIIFFIFLWQFLSRREQKWFWLAALVPGIAMFYITDNGVHQTATYYAFLFLLLFLPATRDLIFQTRRDAWKIAVGLATPIAVACLLFLSVMKEKLFQPVIWQRMGEYILFFNKGIGLLPFHYALVNQNEWAFVEGCAVVLIYVLTLIFITAAIFYRKNSPEHLLVAALSIYGLNLYHYYVYRSAPLAFRGGIIPFVLIMCFWLDQFLKKIANEEARRKILFGITIFTFFALLTTHAFVRYPNIFNPLQNHFSDEKKSMQKELQLSADADFIHRLTTADEKVPLFSSFEPLLLIEADRKPFFYYFPLVGSRYLYMKDFGGTKLITKKQLQETLQQLEEEKPEHVFIEAKLFFGQIPQAYYQKFTALAEIVIYLHQNYTIQEKGNYLLALRRK